MKVAVRGLARELVTPLLWAHAIEVVEDGGDVVLCGELDPPGLEERPRVLWVTAPIDARERWPAALVCSPARVATAPAPEPADDAPLAEVLAAMRVAYARQLPEALAELARAVVDAQRGSAPVADARMLAHRIRGTAGTYGLPAVGKAVARLEDLLVKGDLDPGWLAALLMDVAAEVVAVVAPSAAPRLLVVGAAPPAGADGVPVADLAAAARAVAAGEGHALWLADDADPAALAAHPELAQVPVAVVRDRSEAVASTTLACLLPGAWTRLFGPRP